MIEQIKEFLSTKDDYKVPDELLNALLDNDQRTKLFDSLPDIDLSKDAFYEYFQDEHAQRGALKQDYTPNEVGILLKELIGDIKVKNMLDIASGTGGLSIPAIHAGVAEHYWFEEVSERNIPFLLFNLSIRNVRATVKLGDSLKRSTEKVYQLTPSDGYSDIQTADNVETPKMSIVISNPPYSVKWTPEVNETNLIFGLAPKSKGDMQFVLHGLHQLTDDGRAFYILPHGVLFRNEEKTIREQLIRNNFLDGVIGLPDKLFRYTSIPTLVLALNKNKTDDYIFFIEASREFKKDGKNNLLTDKDIIHIVKTWNDRLPEYRYADISELGEIEQHDFNLNIPRHVDTFVPEYVPPLHLVVNELVALEKEIQQVDAQLYEMFKDLIGTTPDAQRDLDLTTEILKGSDYVANLPQVTDVGDHRTSEERESLPGGNDYNPDSSGTGAIRLFE